MSFPNLRTYAFDANTQVSDNAAAYTASGYLQSGGADGIWDLGGNQGAVTYSYTNASDGSIAAWRADMRGCCRWPEKARL